MSNKYKLITDGTLANTKVADLKGNILGKISSVEIVPKKYITLIKVGGDRFVPTHQDLEYWREIYEKAMKDDDPTIFTHPDVEIERIAADDKAILNWELEMLLR